MINLEQRIYTLIKSIPKAEIKRKKKKNVDVDVF